MFEPRCVITGCALFFDGHPEQCLWGDLWEVEDCWIFNAVLADGEAAAQDPRRLCTDRHITVEANFNRRGVIVAAKEACELSQAAKEYVEKGRQV